MRYFYSIAGVFYVLGSKNIVNNFRFYPFLGGKKTNGDDSEDKVDVPVSGNYFFCVQNWREINALTSEENIHSSEWQTSLAFWENGSQMIENHDSGDETPSTSSQVKFNYSGKWITSFP